MKELAFLLYTSIFTLEKPPSLLQIEGRQHKNQIEIGNTVLTFLDNCQPFITDGMQRFSPGYPSYFSYKRQLLKNYYVSANYHFFFQNRRQFDLMPVQVGRTTVVNYNHASVALGRGFRDRNLLLILTGNLLYRWGKGQDVLTKCINSRVDITPPYTRHPREEIIESSGYHSPGLGFGADLNYIILNRISLGINVQYAYFFEHNRLSNNQIKLETYPPDPDRYFTFQPNRQLLTLHFQVGVLF